VKLLNLIIGAFATLCIAFGAHAQERATKEEAIAMVNAAIAHMQKVGPEQAYRDFTDKSNPTWRNKDIYVSVNRTDGVNLAHGMNDKIVGKNMWDLKDQNGKAMVQEMVAQANKGPGWVEYDWVSPVTKKVEHKMTYVRKFPNSDAVVTAGIYKP
jgi:cytochrome c